MRREMKSCTPILSVERVAYIDIYNVSLAYLQFFITVLVNVQAKIVSLYLMSNTTLESLTTLVETPGVIANHEYPLHYLSGELHLWEVIFNETMYVNLVVLNVSFNQNQVNMLTLKVPTIICRRRQFKSLSLFQN